MFALIVVLALGTVLLYHAQTRDYLVRWKSIKLEGIMPNSATFVVYVQSAFDHFDRREAMRQSWLSDRWRKFYRFNYTFLLGRKLSVASDEIARQREEMARFGDMEVVDSLVDSYENLANKTVLMLKLFDRKYGGTAVKFLVKVDDDTFVNLPKFMDTVEFYENRAELTDAFIAGQVSFGVVPDRNNNSQYYMPYSLYNQSEYPPFVHGPAYMVSLPAVRRLLKATDNVQRVRLEDVYLGLLARMTNVSLFDHKEFHFWPVKTWCAMEKLTSAHYIEPDMMRKLWHEYTNVTDLGKLLPCHMLLAPLGFQHHITLVVLFCIIVVFVLVCFCMQIYFVMSLCFEA